MPALKYRYGEAHRGPILKVIATYYESRVFSSPRWHVSILRGTGSYLSHTTHYENVSDYQFRSLLQRALLADINRPDHVVWCNAPIVEYWTQKDVSKLYYRYDKALEKINE